MDEGVEEVEAAAEVVVGLEDAYDRLLGEETTNTRGRKSEARLGCPRNESFMNLCYAMPNRKESRDSVTTATAALSTWVVDRYMAER